MRDSTADLEWNVASPPLGGPVYEVYTGVLYAAAALADRAEAPGRSVWIFSGRYGVVQASDTIAPYRLPASAILPGVGNVASYWRPHLRDALDPIASADGLVLDCRSGPYQRMWPIAKDAVAVSVRAVRERDGRRTVVSHMAKHYRGELTRHVLAAPEAPTSPEQVAALAEATGLGVELVELKDQRFELTLVIRD
ncbi:hypothetical protein BSZ39_11610 [Bowdeniella nasicola]|uniref:Peroxide stress protein YaaA n=1 Tax=Bowdeniella nasicola TaxID=208480 RepID=A0A1Q5Q020_9ACTO|nr:peroxide stress protein YaaA [Bowdeniella nasicola]OKL53052.1 hypothetical protein BSZ39_11610 [Bowdeniella nasicola]